MQGELLSQLDDAMSLSYTRPLSPENPPETKLELRTKMTMEEIGGRGFLTSTERASLNLPQSLEQIAPPGQGLFTPPAGSCFKNPFDLRKQSGRQSVGSKKSRGKSVSFLDQITNEKKKEMFAATTASNLHDVSTCSVWS